MRFDSHAHVWVIDPDRYGWQPILPQAHVPDRPEAAEDFLAEMDGADVARTVLVQPSSYGWDNSYLFDVLERYPDRFVGVVLVDPADPEVGRRLKDASAKRGVRGARFHLLDAPHAATFVPAAERILAAAGESAMVVDLQARPENLPLVADAARAAPETTIVVDHLGLFENGDVTPLLRLAAAPNVHVKVSGFEVLSNERYPFEDVWPAARSVLDAFGPERLMWGSNFPHVKPACSYRAAAALVDLCFADLPDGDRLLIGRGTAERVWGERP